MSFKLSSVFMIGVQWNLDVRKSLGTEQICLSNGGFVISKTSMKRI